MRNKVIKEDDNLREMDGELSNFNLLWRFVN